MSIEVKSWLSRAFGDTPFFFSCASIMLYLNVTYHRYKAKGTSHNARDIQLTFGWNFYFHNLLFFLLSVEYNRQTIILPSVKKSDHCHMSAFFKSKNCNISPLLKKSTHMSTFALIPKRKTNTVNNHTKGRSNDRVTRQ